MATRFKSKILVYKINKIFKQFASSKELISFLLKQIKLKCALKVYTEREYYSWKLKLIKILLYVSKFKK